MKGTLLLSLILPSQQVWSFFHPEQLTRHTRHLPESTLQKLYNSVMSSPQYRSMQKHQHHQQSQVKTPLANLKHNQNRCLSILSMSMSDRDNKLSTPMTASVEPQKQQRRKKKNKYAKFSKVENDVSNENVVEDASDSSNKSKSSKEIQEQVQVQVLDPFEALLVESQEKNKQIEKEKAMKRNKKFGIELLDDATIVKLKNEKRQRNKILFPDNRSIDPYDPTTYGYTELGTILGPHGVHGLVKVSAVTDFSERLCRPGIRHLKAPNRRSPREIRIVEGRHRLKDEYLVKLEQIGDRNDALKLRGSVLYSRQEERPEDMKENEYMVTDLVSMEVQLVTGYGEEEEFHDDDDDDDDEEGEDIDSIVEDSLSGKFVGIVGGVVLGEEMCTIPGMGQDLLEIILPRGDHGTPSWKDELVLIPFVPEIVPTVDIQRKIIFINPPSGLLDFVYIKEEKTRIKGFLPEKSSWVGNE